MSTLRCMVGQAWVLRLRARKSKLILCEDSRITSGCCGTEYELARPTASEVDIV